jgi:hypothetical protein
MKSSWAMRYLFLETDIYRDVATELFEILTKCAVHEEYRHKYLKEVLCCDKHEFSFHHLAQFFGLMLQTISDVEVFFKETGLVFFKETGLVFIEKVQQILN